MDPDFANKIISYLLKERNLVNKEEDKIVEVPDDVLNQLHSAHNSLKRKSKNIIHANSIK